jgi:hypothetical protein
MARVFDLRDPKDNVLEFGESVAVRFKMNSMGLDFFDDHYRSLRPSPDVP